MQPKHTATRVDGGWAWFDQKGREIERRVTTKYHTFVSGILGPLEPTPISVSIPFDPSEYPKRYRKPRA